MLKLALSRHASLSRYDANINVVIFIHTVTYF